MKGYSLLDCGEGRKLERFGSVRVLRPAPAARGPGRDPDAWADADLEYVPSPRGSGEEGEWIVRRPVPETWTMESAGLRFELACTPAGQVGMFPEQAPLRDRLREWLLGRPDEQRHVLDLFGYTGGSALAAAAAGARVTYVDGARAMVGWMRRNLALNGLEERPVRSFPDDCRRFVEREVRRGSRYDAVVLDPPTFGHGPRGTAFRIERDLEDLLAGVTRLGPALVLLTAHTESWTSARLESSLGAAFGATPARREAGDLVLRAESGARLRAGIFVWWEAS